MYDKKLAPLCEYEIVLLDNIFYSDMDADEDATSYKYSSPYPYTVNMTLKILSSVGESHTNLL